MKFSTPNFLLSSIALLICMIGFSGGLVTIERNILDLMLNQHSQNRTLPEEIVLIDIDQKSLEDMNDIAGSWPWPRAVHGELIEALESLKPKAIVMDILLNEADTFRPDSDYYFSDVVSTNTNVYLPTLLLSDGIGANILEYPDSLKIKKNADADETLNLPLLVPLIVPPEAWRGGLINFLADDDGVGRRYFLEKEVSGWLLPSMPKRLADDFTWNQPNDDAFFLNWYEDVEKRYSYSDVFFDVTSSSSKLKQDFANKIIIIGAAAPGLGDFRPTPLGSTYQGMLILSTAIANLANSDWLEQKDWGKFLYPLLLIFFLVSLYRKLSLLPLGLILFCFALISLTAQYALLSNNNWIVHLATPALSGWIIFFGIALLYWWQERTQRQQAITMFGRFLDPRVVSNLVKGNSITDAKGTQSREISILFSDIRGFTSLSEKRKPEEVVSLLNNYFSRQVKVIFETRGTLDKFIGDAIMAFWGAPADNPHHAYDAVSAALGMVEELEAFRQEFADAGDDFDIGIGIHSGPAVVGFIGSNDRLDYTAIGDSVNLSSRIEGATKGVARILVSESTRLACEASHPGAFEFIDHGEVQVKGREQKVRLYEPRKK